jgi:hypothetical protein
MKLSKIKFILVLNAMFHATLHLTIAYKPGQ